MTGSHLGEIAALTTAICWSFTSLSFEAASKRIGSLQVNFIRLVLAFILLTVYNGIFRHQILPIDASAHNWTWLLLSGFVGFVFGDYFLFKAYIIIGARVTMLVMSLVPPITAILSWMILGETMDLREISAMILTIAGVALVVIERNESNGLLKFSHPIPGILCALCGAIGQAGGLILSKYGMGDYNAFAATQIRVICGITGFGILLLALKKVPELMRAVQNRKAMQFTATGAFFGPFLGVSFSLFAVQHTVAGVASTIMAIVPVLIIPLAILIQKERVTFKEIVGALIAVSGVALYFLV